MKHHSEAEIGAKLRQAQQLMACGQTQAQACKELGVSVMTYHRWRKLYHPKHDHDPASAGTGGFVGGAGGPIDIEDQKRVDEVRVENERLRRIVTDLLLEKVKIEEQAATVFRDKSLKRN